MSVPQGELQCCLTIEQLATNGEVLKRTQYKSTILSLIRNQFRDILLKVNNGKKDMRVNMREFIIHKKFAKDGKATIKLPKQNLQFMLSNCPPDQLIFFLKTLNTKTSCQDIKGYVPGRTRLMSDLPKSFQEISPLNMKELETVHQIRAKKAEVNTPKTTKTMKRKRMASEAVNDKENSQQVSRFYVLSSAAVYGVMINPTHSLSTFVIFQQNKLAKLSSSGSNMSRAVLSPVVLSKEQQKVLTTVLDGRSVFFTGSAGTGKSFLLRRIIGK